MGLTLNVPNTFNQNTPLRSVPSGSTAEPDYTVKFVPQDLTEAQQAQARQNIGAAAAGETGGSAPEIDQYFTIYPSGDTTLSAEAGNINEVWMDGYERSAQQGVYSLNANSVVRVKATNNVCFNFGNTTDEIWVYVPKGIVLSEPIYGTRPNVNLVYYNMSATAQTMNFGGTLWLMTNRLFNGIFSGSLHVILNENTPLNKTGVELPTNVSELVAGFYFPVLELKQLTDTLGNGTLFKQKSGVYGHIKQIGYTLSRVELPCVSEECIQLTYSSLGTSVMQIFKNDVGGYGLGWSVEYIYQGSRPCKFKYVTNKNDLQPGEWCWVYGDWHINLKPYGDNYNGNTTIYIKLQAGNNTFSRHQVNTACQGIIFPMRTSLPEPDRSYVMTNCDFTKLNNTIVFPEWLNGDYGGATASKIVYLNKNLTSASRRNDATELIFSNTSVPGSVFSVVQDSNVTKAWFPRATYDLMLQDANWSAYASKLLPYDFLSFGPDNYVMPVALS